MMHGNSFNIRGQDISTKVMTQDLLSVPNMEKVVLNDCSASKFISFFGKYTCNGILKGYIWKLEYSSVLDI